ncbi:MAG: adenylate/guanylate cyclase domain-containing protein, partial [Novosphingobium sp.]|nr:adenylate/guanylate cyclase domain-containing protein [Novosphingobium sp.]
GHIFAGDAQIEAGLRQQIDDWLDERNVGIAFGALAAGADLLVAEAVLARGAELNIVLPFAVDDFIEQSLRPAGESWVPRFKRCLDAAASLTMATEMAYVGDPEQFAYGSRVAMGLAKLRSQHLGNKPLQLALWDGQAARGAGGTGGDVAIWRKLAGESRVLEPSGISRNLARPPSPDALPHERVLAAMLFTDFPGFSKLTETVLPIFWDGVMGSIADVIEDHRSTVLTQNSWGDALYAVASSAADAARIALDLQDRLRNFDYSRLGLDNCGGMRIGAHFGPAFRTDDRITGRVNYYGTEVSRAARIEPVTPPGAVFVTEPLAAILALESPEEFRCRYVGRISLAKDYGTFPMYSLTRNEAGQDWSS